MNKSQLVDALADRLGDRRASATAVDALLQILVDTVAGGESVSLAGFGVFESRARAARTGRNPRTGETVEVPATTVPAFRPGTGFRNAVAGHPAAAAQPGTPVTNGAGGQAAGAALHGAVELSAPASVALGADAPAKATRPAAGAATKSRKKLKAAAPEDAGTKSAGTKSGKDAKDTKHKKEKGGKKNKK